MGRPALPSTTHLSIFYDLSCLGSPLFHSAESHCPVFRCVICVYVYGCVHMCEYMCVYVCMYECVYDVCVAVMGMWGHMDQCMHVKARGRSHISHSAVTEDGTVGCQKAPAMPPSPLSALVLQAHTCLHVWIQGLMLFPTGHLHGPQEL